VKPEAAGRRAWNESPDACEPRSISRRSTKIMGGSLEGYLGEIRRQCGQVHGALYQTYISYPIEAALEGLTCSTSIRHLTRFRLQRLR